MPASKSGFMRWKNSIASGLLIFDPKPLSVSAYQLPSSARFMARPDIPWTGWPMKGSEMPVLCAP